MDSKWIEAEFILISLQWFSQQYLKWQGWVGSAPFSPPWPPSFVPSSSASPCWPFLSSASAPLSTSHALRGSRGWDAAEPAGIAGNIHPHLRQPLPLLRETPLPPLGTGAPSIWRRSALSSPRIPHSAAGARFIKSLALRPQRGRGRPLGPSAPGRAQGGGRTSLASGS